MAKPFLSLVSFLLLIMTIAKPNSQQKARFTLQLLNKLSTEHQQPIKYTAKLSRAQSTRIQFITSLSHPWRSHFFVLVPFFGFFLSLGHAN
jgi:ABC-type lipoprotein export system ATPase subunit